MGNVTCRNCGNENVYFKEVNDNVVHYDCLDCNYEWSAPPVREGQVLFNIAAGIAGIGLIIYGVSYILTHLHDAFNHQSPIVLLSAGTFLVGMFAYRSLRTYRLIRK
ncbi:MAG: hypothetical protein JWQ38_3445 [Flavipsychrobacter sp.]|nr:hypothetical protein [Flavipsychrobacter sp.]